MPLHLPIAAGAAAVALGGAAGFMSSEDNPANDEQSEPSTYLYGSNYGSSTSAGANGIAREDEENGTGVHARADDAASVQSGSVSSAVSASMLKTVILEPGSTAGIDCFSTTHVPPTVARPAKEGALKEVPVGAQLVEFNGTETTAWTTEMLMWRLTSGGSTAGVLIRMVFQPPMKSYDTHVDVSPDQLITVTLPPGKDNLTGVVFSDDDMYPICLTSFDQTIPEALLSRGRSMSAGRSGSGRSGSDLVPSSPGRTKMLGSKLKGRKKSWSSKSKRSAEAVSPRDKGSPGADLCRSPLKGQVPRWSELVQVDGKVTTDWKVDDLIRCLQQDSSMNHVLVFRRPTSVLVQEGPNGHSLGAAFYNETVPPRIKRFVSRPNAKGPLEEAGVERFSEIVQVNEENASAWTCAIFKEKMDSFSGPVTLTFRRPRQYTTTL